MSNIKVTTSDLWSYAQELSSRAMDFSNIIGKYRSAINKMKDSCSAFNSWSFMSFENQSVARYVTLMETLTKGSQTAMNCVFAYEEANTELINSYSGWFDGVEVNTIGGSAEAYYAEQRRKEQEEWDALVGSQYVDYYDDPKGLYRSRINENANTGWYARDKMQCVGYAWARFEYLTNTSPSFSCGQAKFIGNTYTNNPNLEMVTEIDRVKVPSLAYHSRGNDGHVVCVEKVIVNAEGKHIVYYTAGNQESGKPDGTLYSYVYEDNPGEFEGFVQLK